ncbi:MDR family MFS transporter [Caulobacter sp. CCUG 60055]|uniref:MDR family MFS transporter n=1 Tax=Caulobacter sp. CCUG 60055 TaxID=2100090 RepID=UPI001FA74AD6|nr:MDR family MFS transporter [Caulobacter sp. CCUG 60055]
MSQAKTFTEDERRITLIGVMIVFLLSALDQSIVGTAMPRIIAELNGLSLYAWVTTAYLLTSTVMVPIWGKLGDLYGRKPILLAGIGIFLLGSWLSGLAGEFGDMPLLGGGMIQLIVFRAIQGIGGGALFTTAFAIIADLFPPRERGKFAGLFGSVFGLATVLGPVIGGYFTDHGTVHLGGHVVAGWRWVFYLNLPLSLLSLFMIIVKMPKLSHRATGEIDWAGAGLLIAAFTPLLLALSLGGHDYAWTSPTILGLFAGAAVALALFLIAERAARSPILPLDLFANKVFALSNVAGFLIAMSFLGVVTFLPLYMQLGMGLDATTSGLLILPLMGGLIVASTVAGRLVTQTGRYKPFMIGGAVLLGLGVLLLSRVGPQTSMFDLSWRLALVGMGLGPGQSLFSIAAQNAVPPTQLGVVTSANQFFRQIGSTLGVAVFGALLTHNLTKGLGPRAAGVDIGALEGMALKAQAAGASASVDPALRRVISDAITGMYGFSLLIIAAGFAAILFIPELPMRSRQVPGEPVLAKDQAKA